MSETIHEIQVSGHLAKSQIAASFIQKRIALLLFLGVSLGVVGSGQGTSQDATSTTATDDGWHLGLSPYLWFAGLHGETGVNDHITSVHASTGDLLSHLKIGFMGQAEARKRRFLLSSDLLWMRLGDDKALSLTDRGLLSIKVGIHLFVLTPKAGYRVVDKPKLKVDAQVGVRYWHIGESLEFQPQLFSGVSRSQNWADVVAGGRIQFPLSPKATVTIAGDAGGGGANSDYQIVGLLGYKVGKKAVLQAGYRYLDVNYRNSQNFVFDAIVSGALVGVTFNLK